jgi:transcriptional regulator with XRE-family HTH domain
MTPGTLIRTTRRRHRLTQSSLARRARTSQAQISRIERDETSPSVETLRRLLECMGERVQLAARPLASGNQSATDLLADYESLDPGDRVKQAAELSRVVTSIASGA